MEGSAELEERLLNKEEVRGWRVYYLPLIIIKIDKQIVVEVDRVQIEVEEWACGRETDKVRISKEEENRSLWKEVNQ